MPLGGEMAGAIFSMLILAHEECRRSFNLNPSAERPRKNCDRGRRLIRKRACAH
jgi:hypothetical protein